MQNITGNLKDLILKIIQSDINTIVTINQKKKKKTQTVTDTQKP